MRAPVTQENKRRIALGFAIIVLVLFLIVFKLAVIQIVKSEEYTELAITQQTKDSVIEPRRGIIYDRNGKELATTSDCYTLWVRPVEIGENYKPDKIKEMTEKISDIAGIDKEELFKILTGEEHYISVAKYLSREQANEIWELKYNGIELLEAKKRNYPKKNFASQLLGSVMDENVGRTGIELQYDRYLKGVAGRWVKNTDLSGDELVGGTESYFAAENGMNVVLNIDEGIQFFAEKAIKKAKKKTGAERIMCLIMDPQTGAVLASAATNGFDPNEPYKVPKEDRKKYEKMSVEEKNAYLSAMWKNPLVSDTYEPGSTFKLITASSAIEEKAINLNEHFYCSGSFRVEDYVLHCWSKVAHGSQNIRQALGNSCNPALAAVAKKLGKRNFYKYIKLYGITDKTGIDYPGESNSIVQNVDNIHAVELANIGFGQGISVTPIQLLTAVNAIGNGGKLMQPQYVKGLANDDMEMVKTFEPVVVRKVISQKTAKEMRDIMEYVVEKGGGVGARIQGYKIGGKTGTANKVLNGKYVDDYYSSFLGMAPIDDPKISILLIVDSPKNAFYGSVVAAPVAKEILQNVLRYLNINPDNTVKSTKLTKTLVKVPDVTGMKFSQAEKVLKDKGLKIRRERGVSKKEDFVIKDQYPKGNSSVVAKSEVYVYKTGR